MEVCVSVEIAYVWSWIFAVLIGCPYGVQAANSKEIARIDITVLFML